MKLTLTKKTINMSEDNMSKADSASEQNTMNISEKGMNVQSQNKILNSDLKLNEEQCYLMQLMTAVGSELITEEVQKKK